MANLEADFYDFEALALLKTAPFSLRHAVHPLCCSHSHTLFEGGIERVSHGDRCLGIPRCLLETIILGQEIGSVPIDDISLGFLFRMNIEFIEDHNLFVL